MMEKDEKVENPKPKSYFGVRHIQAVMIFFAFFIAYTMRVNMSMAIVAMTDPTQEHSFDWNVKIQSLILSSFFWGNVVLQIPAGELAARFGGMWLIFIVISVNSVVSLLMPISSTYGGWKAVCACRVLQGLSQGSLFPACHNLISKWIPIEEKSSLGTFMYAGAHLGTAAQMISAGYVAEYLGWSYIFYINGIIGSIWSVGYFILGSDSPQNSKMISDEERLYIQTSLSQIGGSKKLKTPWRKIFTSVPFIALGLVHCGNSWGFWTLMTEMPSYMKQILGVDIKANGVLSALPYLTIWVVSFPFGFMADYLIRREIMSLTAVRKLSNTIGTWGPAIALLGLSYSPAGNVAAAVALLSVVVGLNAGHMTGFLLVHIDMAPNFGGSMIGVTNFFGNVVSIIAPLAAGAFLVDETSVEDWRSVFYLASAIYFLTNLVFLIFGTSETQPWNNPEEEKREITKLISSPPEEHNQDVQKVV